MFRHLTVADYAEQPWANGRGRTVELLRVERDGALQLRLSMAMVVENGPFSLFPGLERSLTVISGPGFRLKGRGIELRCDALVPVAFPGDVPVRAVATRGQQSNDFNVMTARHLAKPVVALEHDGSRLPAGGTLALFALGEVSVNGLVLQRHDLVLTDQELSIAGRWPVIAVRLREDWTAVCGQGAGDQEDPRALGSGHRSAQSLGHGVRYCPLHRAGRPRGIRPTPRCSAGLRTGVGQAVWEHLDKPILPAVMARPLVTGHRPGGWLIGSRQYLTPAARLVGHEGPAHATEVLLGSTL